MLGFPAESAMKLLLAGDQDGRIAGAPGRDFARNFAAGDFLGGVDDFEDREPTAVSDVESFAGDSFDSFEGADVGIGDVQNVDIVTDASSVRRGVVRAENFELRNDAESGVEDFRNEMGFDTMAFAALHGGASGVEIAESGVMESVVGAIVGEDFFEAELGFAVGVDGIFGMIFGDGDGVRFAVGGSRRGKDYFFHAVASHGVQEIDAGSDVGGVESAGLADGLGD